MLLSETQRTAGRRDSLLGCSWRPECGASGGAEGWAFRWSICAQPQQPGWLYDAGSNVGTKNLLSIRRMPFVPRGPSSRT